MSAPPPNIPALSASADANYRTWLNQVQTRLEKYRQRAIQQQQQKQPQPSSPSSKPPTSPKSNSSDDALLQMTRREIEVLAAYHCELQRMISDQNEKHSSISIELEETNALAERLQVEVEKKTGGGVSPRRQAKQQMRGEISRVRKQIEEAHQSLVAAQHELESVRAEHADVRTFISKQFFPVARVSQEQKWPSQQQQQQQQGKDASSSPNNNNQNSGAGGGGFTVGGKTFVVRSTKAAELRDQMVQERRAGFVPGTSVKASTIVESRLKKNSDSKQEGGQEGGGGGEGLSSQQQQSYRESAQRLKNIKDGIDPSMVGHLRFVRRRVDTTSGGGSNTRTKSPALSQERHARASQDRPAFKPATLHVSNPVHGIIPHHDPAVYEHTYQ